MSAKNQNDVQTTKPKLKRVYVSARDPETGTGEYFPLYNTTPAAVRQMLGAAPRRRPHKHAATT